LRGHCYRNARLGDLTGNELFVKDTCVEILSASKARDIRVAIELECNSIGSLYYRVLALVGRYVYVSRNVEVVT
jgi:hypothetical protein